MRVCVHLLSILLLLLGVISASAGDGVTVFAAASMKDAIEHAGAMFEGSTGIPIKVVPASSSVLAKQVVAGAPADLYISANTDWMDWVGDRGAIDKNTRADIASNALIIAVSGSQTSTPATLLEAGRFAMGDPGHVPAGIYAKQALEHLGLWNKVRPNAVFGENARVALELVSRGEVGAAIVYRSDLAVAPDLAAAYTFDPSAHDRVLYPAALTTRGGKAAADFLEFLRGAQGQKILRDAGFFPPPVGAGK